MNTATDSLPSDSYKMLALCREIIDTDDTGAAREPDGTVVVECGRRQLRLYWDDEGTTEEEGWAWASAEIRQTSTDTGPLDDVDDLRKLIQWTEKG